MSYQSKPTTNGVYSIKVLTQDRVIESVPAYNAGLKLAPPKPLYNKQLWNLTQVSGKSNVWTMTSVEDKSGLVCIKDQNRYWGHGYPYPQTGPSHEWSIIERTSEGQTFSKIKLNGSSDCFDSCDPDSDAVHFYYDHDYASDGPNQCYVFKLIPDPSSSSKPLDVLFIQDFTGSQQQYIDTARAEIGQICTNLIGAGKFAPSDLRFGLVAFRDHPPQDISFVTKVFGFTSDANSMAANLASLSATGGGDGPEAQADGLYDALHASWNTKATKVAVLITDAPPHGIGEAGDGFPKGCPLQRNPLQIAKRMAALHITLNVVACEPTLSTQYKEARHFYEGLVQKTGGKVLNLGDPGALTNLIVGSALEAVDSDALVLQHYSAIRLQSKGANAAAISQKLHQDLSAANVQHHTLTVENMYEPNEQGEKNAQIWFDAETLEEATAKIQVSPNRIKEQYLSNGSVATSVEKKPINLAQAQSIVQKSLVREF